jgi:hypothetical protein
MRAVAANGRRSEMPKLKTILDTLDDVDEAHREFYTENEDGKFVLAVEGFRDHPEVQALKTAFDRQKETNKTTKEKLDDVEAKLKKIPEDFDPAAYAEMKARIEAIDDLDDDDPDPDPKAKGDPKKLREKIEARLQAKFDKVERELTDAKVASEARAEYFKKTLDEYIAKGALVEALVGVKIKPELMGAAKALHIGKIEVTDDDGKHVALVKGDIGEQTVTEYVEAWSLTDEGKAMILADKNSGSGDKDDPNNRERVPNPWNPKTRNLTEQGRITREDFGKACRLAREAGMPEPRKE